MADLPDVPTRLRAVATGDTAAWKPPAPSRAATVVLLRQADPATVETWLMRRHRTMAAAPGMSVFPGGGVSADDHAGPIEDPLVAAAVRELAEETGLTVDDPHRLVRFTRWVTPEVLPHRHDTEFFAVAVSSEERPTLLGTEAESAQWVSPAAALESWARRDISLLPPTAAVLTVLREAATMSEAFAALTQLPLRPLMPAPSLRGGEFEWHLIDAETRAEVSPHDLGLPPDWRAIPPGMGR